jgi:glycosyltransferase involved in cell wall biosynthesis
VIVMAADLQDPPELIPEFLQKWREGYPVVLGQKLNSEESWLFFNLRRSYYKLVKRLADVDLVENATGFGLYDRTVIEQLRALDEPYPYVRGLVCELGYPIARVPYAQPQRKRGITKNNFYTLYDVAMLGITSHSKVPLRLATYTGIAISVLAFLYAFVTILRTLVFGADVPGFPSIIVSVMFFSGIQLIFLGIIGEYIGRIFAEVKRRPLYIVGDSVGLDDPALQQARPAGPERRKA